MDPRLSFSPDRLKLHRMQAGMSQAALAAKLRELTGTASVTANYVYRWETGRRTPDDWLVALALALGIEISDLCEPAPSTILSSQHRPDRWEEVSDVMRRGFLTRGLALTTLPAVVRALDIIGDGHTGALTDGLGELVDHYVQAITLLPPNTAYDELLAIRSYAGSVLDHSGTTPRKTDLVLTCGWLSSLLAVAAHDMGEHASARLWCSDAERYSEQARHPELAGWAYLTRAMIAHYQRLPQQSAALAAKGLQKAPLGTVAHARLAAHQMRATAMNENASADARRYAVTALKALPADVPTTGVYSINLAEDPPYTATSLLLAGQHQEAAAATQRVIQTCYTNESLQQGGGNPSGYARSLLILGLAQAGAGDLDQAAETGLTALNISRLVWSTMALAGQLDQRLTTSRAGQMASAFSTRYREVADQLSSRPKEH